MGLGECVRLGMYWALRSCVMLTLLARIAVTGGSV